MQKFPSLRITQAALTPEGSFAEAQAAYLQPDSASVTKLDALLQKNKIGVVAHYYMDPELQGVLAGCSWTHIGVSDSLLMADRGITMARSGCDSIVVLGVDFMSENARAMLDDAGLQDVPVYRVAQEQIGCSLAEAAEAPAYAAYLAKGAAAGNALHVIYINTSLVTKAKSHAQIPTITCTSSNVVKTVLQAAAQIDDVQIYFGPDTYMGENLDRLLEVMSEMDDEAIAEVHPAHDQKSIASLRERFHYFKQGNCIVHHMFGAEVVAQIREHHADALISAHLEVPGEMFGLGLERQKEDRGVVGSTSNILSFIQRKVGTAIDAAQTTSPTTSPTTLQIVLGTEAGMITPIVREVQRLLIERDSALAVDIVFPVASDAIATTEDASFPIVPGVSGGEGCTTAGGCATCPYMKMNSLDALFGVCEDVGSKSDSRLRLFEPKKYQERIGVRTIASLGGEPILHMRHFQKNGVLSDALISDIRTR